MNVLKWIGIVVGVIVGAALLAYGLLETSKEVEANTPADWQAPKTSFGHPSLEGTWTSTTVTTLERVLLTSDGPVPVPFGKLRLNKIEAGMIEGGFNSFFQGDLAPSDPDAPAPETGGDVGSYNTSRGNLNLRFVGRSNNPISVSSSFFRIEIRSIFRISDDFIAPCSKEALGLPLQFHQ